MHLISFVELGIDFYNVKPLYTNTFWAIMLSHILSSLKSSRKRRVNKMQYKIELLANTKVLWAYRFSVHCFLYTGQRFPCPVS